ncbi:MAG: fructose-1,6-bisphosphatase [Chloroflexota bacterium]|nr:fructose-1,6-bisphosphatase [Chloroflexota bacterium]
MPDGKFQLLHEQESLDNTQEYYHSLIDTIISIERVREFMIAMAELIQRLAIARLHVIGDIYDRGLEAFHYMLPDMRSNISDAHSLCSS